MVKGKKRSVFFGWSFAQGDAYKEGYLKTATAKDWHKSLYFCFKGSMCQYKVDIQIYYKLITKGSKYKRQWFYNEQKQNKESWKENQWIW